VGPLLGWAGRSTCSCCCCCCCCGRPRLVSPARGPGWRPHYRRSVCARVAADVAASSDVGWRAVLAARRAGRRGRGLVVMFRRSCVVFGSARQLNGGGCCGGGCCGGGCCGGGCCGGGCCGGGCCGGGLGGGGLGGGGLSCGSWRWWSPPCACVLLLTRRVCLASVGVRYSLPQGRFSAGRGAERVRHCTALLRLSAAGMGLFARRKESQFESFDKEPVGTSYFGTRKVLAVPVIRCPTEQGKGLSLGVALRESATRDNTCETRITTHKKIERRYKVKTTRRKWSP
jgi:hypothetical protein